MRRSAQERAAATVFSSATTSLFCQRSTRSLKTIRLKSVPGGSSPSTFVSWPRATSMRLGRFSSRKGQRMEPEMSMMKTTRSLWTPKP